MPEMKHIEPSFARHRDPLCPEPRHRAPASRFKVGGLDDDGRRRFDVRAQVSDALRSAAPSQGAY